MTPQHKAIPLLALIPGVLIGALILAIAYPLIWFGRWALKGDTK